MIDPKINKLKCEKIIFLNIYIIFLPTLIFHNFYFIYFLNEWVNIHMKFHLLDEEKIKNTLEDKKIKL